MDAEYGDLGRYVRVRARAGGSHKVFFEVPKRLRPEQWPPVIDLPEIGQKHGSLRDPKFRQRVIDNAARLNASIDDRRQHAELTAIPERSLPKLAEIYKGRDVYRKLGASRRYRNANNIEKIIQWSASRGHPDVGTLSAMDVDDFLSNYEDRPSTKFDLRSNWNMLFATAKYAGWIKESPLEPGNWERLDPQKVRLWTLEDAERYSRQAVAMKQPGLGAMILTMFFTGQRCGDMRRLRWGREYRGDRLIFKQSKTNKLVDIPIAVPLRRVIESARLEGSDYLFNDYDTGGQFTAANLGLRFAEVRHALSVEGEEMLYLRALRHSCVLHLFKANISVPDIVNITGHALPGAYRILQRYLPNMFHQSEGVMRQAWASLGFDAGDFGEVAPLADSDWACDPDRPDLYQAPKIDERNFNRLYAARTGQHRTGATIPAADF